MSLYKRGEVWWVRFTAPNGRRIRRTTGTEDKEAAREYHDRLKAELWRVKKLGERPEYRWNDAVVKWLKEKSHKASIDKDKEIFRWVDPYLNGLKLRQIDRALLDEIQDAKVKISTRATTNRYMGHLRAVLRRAAYEWEWIDKAPKVPMFPISNKRIRWIKPFEAERLISFLPDHQAVMARFALATGLRQRNVCRLEWSQIDLQRKVAWIHPDQAKARKAIGVPLNTSALEVLRQLIGQHDQYVFTYKGNVVWQVNTKAWRKAVLKAGLEDFRWHDLRHTWASWHVQSGTPLNVLQELGGWECIEMVRRYAHLSSEHLLPHAENIVPNMEDTKLAQSKIVLLSNR
ncbi:MAG: site-specific integrase [Proteobacteria bacterium]|nr:site-specific integrase [Pseudomonadota bacterium]NOG61079.1 site-specific integrase [Pseudomonadota bacterium]